MSSYVYVISGDHRMTKIGVSTNPLARIAQLRTGSPFPIDFAWVGYTPGTGFGIESLAHAALARRCTSNGYNGTEWFDIEPEVAIEIVNQAAGFLDEPISSVDPDSLTYGTLPIKAEPDGRREKKKMIYWLLLACVLAALLGGKEVGFFPLLILGIWAIVKTYRARAIKS